MPAMMRTLTDAAEVVRGRRRIYYGWWILAAALVLVGMTNGVSFWSFGLFINPLEDEFGWSRASVSLGISLSLLLSGLAAPWIGRLVDSRGPRRVILAGTVLTIATYVLLATTQELWQWYAYMALNGAVRHLIFIIPAMTLVSRWFARRRSFAIALVGSGLFAGAMILVPFLRLLIDLVSWDGTFLAIGVIVLVVDLPIALLVVRDHPSDLGLSIDGDVTETGAPESARPVAGVTLREAIHAPIFWTLATGLMLFTFGMLTWIVHAVPFYESEGVSPGWAAGLTSITAGGGMVSRILTGRIADRFPKYEYVGITASLLLGSSIIILLVDVNPIMIAFFLLLFVSAFGMGGALLETLVLTQAFGVRHFATIFGVVMLFDTVGMLVGPTAAGVIFDETGSYDWALLMILLAFGSASLLFLAASRMLRPADAIARGVSPAAAQA